MPVPTERIRRLNQAPVRPDRAFVLYWMTMSRRTRSNPALERAAELSRELDRPVLVLEPLRCAYPYASDRLHAFVLQGMAENARRLAGKAHYLPWLERRRGEGRGLLQALAAQACAVVADDHPGFFLPRMLEAGAAQVDVRLEAVDGACLVPYRLAGRDFPTAHSYRRFLQAELPAWLERLPVRDPLRRAAPPGRLRLPPDLARRWPAEPLAALERPERLLGELPIDHRVGACVRPGGSAAAEQRLAAFVKGPLSRYAEDRSHPDLDGTSGLSPYLHFGHLGTFDAVRAVLAHEGWGLERLSRNGRGSRAGYWGVSEPVEAFLDQLVTWRELGFVGCAMRPDHGTYASLPAWARATLEKHAGDPRPHRYGLEALREGRTFDRLWNAAQRQLLSDGMVHNSLRMLWGKKILEWSDGPEQALAAMLELNDRYALDGRDPCSLTGILWCLGKYDRPWGPERPIFGTVRFMSSDSSRRKWHLARYLERWGAT